MAEDNLYPTERILTKKFLTFSDVSLMYKARSSITPCIKHNIAYQSKEITFYHVASAEIVGWSVPF